MVKNGQSGKILNNQKGFTLIELIIVIVVLGILSAVAVPKYMDMKNEAAKATADGVFAAAQGAAAINFAAGLVGKAAADRPAYEATKCSDGMIKGDDAGTCLLTSLDGTPDGWSASGKTITSTFNSKTYTITVTTDESTTSKAVLTLTSS
jgi:MSHA pilin protein MshA